MVGCWLAGGWLLVGSWLAPGWFLVGFWLVGWLAAGWLLVGWLAAGLKKNRPQCSCFFMFTPGLICCSLSDFLPNCTFGHLEVSGKHLEVTWEACGRYLGGIWEVWDSLGLHEPGEHLGA